MLETLFETNTFHLLECDPNHVSAIVESDHAKMLTGFTPNAFSVAWINFDNNNAEHNSKRGMQLVSFIGETLAFEVTKVIVTLPLRSTQ